MLSNLTVTEFATDGRHQQFAGLLHLVETVDTGGGLQRHLPAGHGVLVGALLKISLMRALMIRWTSVGVSRNEGSWVPDSHGGGRVALTIVDNSRGR